MSTQLRAAIYCRVSDPGAADKFGMEAQRAECLAYAERHGWRVVAIFQDFQTGTELFERAEMTRCREAMRRREFDILIVDRLDRLSRKAHHQGFIRTEAEYAGVTVVSATEDLSNPILVGVMAGLSEADRDRIVRNMQRGKRHKVVEMGLPLGQGKPPYGLTWRMQTTQKPDGTIIATKVGYDPDPATIGHLRRIFRDYANGMSLRQLSIALQRDGVLPPYHDRTGSTTWSVGTLRAILTDPVYIGKAEAFRTKSTREPNREGVPKRKHRVVRNEERVRLPDGTAPVVIAPETFARVQARLEANKRESCRRDRNPEIGILRRGFGRCGVCDHPLTVFFDRGKYYYHCHSDSRRLWGCTRSGVILVEKLDEAIWQWLTAELADEERVRWHLEQQIGGDDPEAHDLEMIDRQLRDIERKQANLAAAIAALDGNPDALGPLLAQLDVLGKQKRAAEAERTDILARQAQREAAREHIRDIQAHCREIAERMARVTSFADRREMLAVLGVKVWVYPRSHRPRWVAKSIIRPEGITSENVFSASQNTEHLPVVVLTATSDDLACAAD